MSKPNNTLAQMVRVLDVAGLEPVQDGETISSQCPLADCPTSCKLTTHVNGAGPAYACTTSGAVAHDTVLEAISARSNPAEAAHAALRAYQVSWTDDKTPKLVLPAVPEHTDTVGLTAWLTNVLRLDRNHPVTGAVREGVRGPDAHVEIRRAGAPALRFEPAAIISSARRLGPALDWLTQPTDGERYGFKDEHCTLIARVVNRLCGASQAPSEAQETTNIIGTFLQGAEAIDGHTTHGTSGQRFEAAQALRCGDGQHLGSRWGQSRYLIDTETGELVMRVSDLQATARVHVGSSMARGWLDARVDNLPGWARAKLDGHGQPGRAGRQGPHARIDVYRGPWPVSEAHDAD